MNVEGVLNAIAARVPRPKNEYVDSEGITRCAVCHARTLTEIEFNGKKRIVPCACKCETEEERQERLAKMARRRRRCFDEPTMEEWTFAQDDRKQAKISDALQRYTERFEEFRNISKGFLLHGTVGTGKTFLAACVANRLIDKGYSVRMTNITTLTNDLQGMFDGRQEYISALARHDFVIIDDVGSERKSATGYAQEILYNVIDSLYRAGTPFAVTSNLTSDKMENPESIEYARIFDRIFERCFPIEVKGKSRRRAELRNSYSDMKDMLGL